MRSFFTVVLVATFLAFISPASAVTRRQEICNRARCTPATITCPSSTACQTLYADRVRSVCGLSAPNTLCLTNADRTCLQNESCLAQEVTAPAAPTTGGGATLCCRCQKAGRSVCIQNITDAGAATDCTNILQQSATLRGLQSSNAAAFEGFSCANAPLGSAQCRTVAQSGTCGGDTFTNPPVVNAGGLLAALTGPANTNTNTPTSTENARPFRALTPELGVPIPGVQLSPPILENGEVTIPFLAQYIAAGYRYGVSVAIVAAIIMTIYGGFRYLMGSAFEDVSRGKQIITDSIGGLMIALGAYLLLATVNPATLRLPSLSLSTVRTESSDQADADSRLNEDGSVGATGPHSLCRENLLHPNPNAWVAACGPQGLQPSTNSAAQTACTMLTTQCGRDFGYFLRGISDNCRSKRFDGIYGLDGVTFGILDFTEDNLVGLLNDYRRENPTGYERAFGSSGVEVNARWFCETNRSARGLMCHEGFRNAMQQVLRDPAFIRVQTKTAYRLYRGRLSLASHFSSPYGRVMFAIVLNNPGRCGSEFAGVFRACGAAFSGNDENQKIECFLREYEMQGCRNGVSSARSRVVAIRGQLTGLSRAPAPLQVVSQDDALNCLQRAFTSR